jgi:hypothetical protein
MDYHKVMIKVKLFVMEIILKLVTEMFTNTVSHQRDTVQSMNTKVIQTQMFTLNKAT